MPNQTKTKTTVASFLRKSGVHPNQTAKKGGKRRAGRKSRKAGRKSRKTRRR